jgi:hypothetical protein
VIGSFQRRFWVFLASAAAAVGAWKSLPGSGLDRAAFTRVAGGFTNPQPFVEGLGSDAVPWKMWSSSAETQVNLWQDPVVVSLADDREGFFQAFPHAPIDLAVVLKNLRRLGVKHASTAAVLAWDAPDPIGLAALENSLAGFDSLVTASPLSRGPVALAMPPAFRRASIPLASVQGDSFALPVVNRIPVPGVILGAQNSMAGFSVIESEPVSGFPVLMARWEDRVVFSFAVLTVLQRLDLPPSGLEIRMGEYLKLGPDGPLIPIDAYGRLGVPRPTISPAAEISVESLIDGGDSLFPQQAPEPVILRDDRTGAEPAAQAFSRQLLATIAALTSEQGIASSHDYPRLATAWEIGILAAVVCGLTLCCGMVNFPRRAAALSLVCLVGVAQWIWLEIASVWLPGLPMLGAILAAVMVSKVVAIPRPAPTPIS